MSDKQHGVTAFPHRRRAVDENTSTPAPHTGEDTGSSLETGRHTHSSNSDDSDGPATAWGSTPEEVTADPSGDPTENSLSWQTGLEHQTRIGRYIIIDELGRGGMGLVFRALDPELDRVVALKLLLWNSPGKSVEHHRFLTEGRVMATLKHPGIVNVLDIGMHRHRPFFAMEYVKGSTLQARLEREGPLPVRSAVRMLAEVARAVHYAHEHGIVHRDIKPANILLEDGEHPRLSDFGVARLATEAAALTVTGQVLGTLAYMAPEQAAGDHARVGPLSDVYALGVVAFHMLTGRPPFGNSLPGFPASQGREEPPSLRRQAPSIPADVDQICRMAMAYDPRDRYRSALELAEDCERFLRGEPVQASRPALRRRLAWNFRRNRPLLVGAGAMLLVTLATVGGWRQFSAWRLEQVQAQQEAQAKSRLEVLERELETLWHRPLEKKKGGGIRPRCCAGTAR